MKKLLLTLGACALAIGVNAASIDNLLPENASNFENGEKNGWSSYAQQGNEMDFVVVEDGYDSGYCIMAENKTEGEQYFFSQISYTFDENLPTGNYMMSFQAKCSVDNGAIQIAYSSNQTWIGGLYREISLSDEWQEYKISFSLTQEDANVLQINLGKVIGNYYFDDIEFGPVINDSEGGVPNNANIVKTFYNGDYNVFWGWGGNSTFENSTELTVDGMTYTSGKYSNPEASANLWEGQVCAPQLSLAIGETYYFNFKVLADSSLSGVSAQFQNDDNNDWQGTFDTFDIEAGDYWQDITISGTTTAGSTDPTILPTRIILNLANYVGNLYFTEATVYTLGNDTDGVEALEAADNGEVVVYNLQGVKQNVKSVSELAKGIYIVNGKKVLVK